MGADASSGPAGGVPASVDVPVRQPETSGARTEKVQEKANPLNDELKAFVDSLQEHYRIPGISIGVVHDDETYLSVRPSFPTSWKRGD